MSQRPAGSLGRYPATLAFFAINALFLVRTMASTDSGLLVDAGAVRTDLLWAGDFWRLLTAGFVHVGFTHCFMNMLGLLLLGRIAEHLLGTAWYVVLYLLSGVLGFAMSQTFHPVGVLTAGASASGFGIVGMMLGSEMRRGRHLLEVFQTSFGRLLLLYIGFSFVWGIMQPNIDNYAHAGGFLGGFLGAYFLMPSPWETQNRRRTWTRIGLSVLMIQALVYPVIPVPNPVFHLYAGVNQINAHQYGSVARRLTLAESLGEGSFLVDYYRALLEVKEGDFEAARSSLEIYFGSGALPHPDDLAAYFRWRYAAAQSGQLPLTTAEWHRLRQLATTPGQEPARRRALTHLTWMAILLDDRDEIGRFTFLLEQDGSRSYYARGTLGACRVMLGDGARGEEELTDSLRTVEDNLDARSHLPLDVALARPPFLFLSDLEALYTALLALARFDEGDEDEADRLLERALELDPLCEVVPVVQRRIEG